MFSAFNNANEDLDVDCFVIAAHFAEGDTLGISNCTWFTITVLHTLSLRYNYESVILLPCSLLYISRVVLHVVVVVF